MLKGNIETDMMFLIFENYYIFLLILKDKNNDQTPIIEEYPKKKKSIFLNKFM